MAIDFYVTMKKIGNLKGEKLRIPQNKSLHLHQNVSYFSHQESLSLHLVELQDINFELL